MDAVRNKFSISHFLDKCRTKQGTEMSINRDKMHLVSYLVAATIYLDWFSTKGQI